MSVLMIRDREIGAVARDYYCLEKGKREKS
jgi:hypothetical protein